MAMMKTVVILGAGWAGLPLAHKLLKHTAPHLNLKVILVTPNTHFFWNVAATRGIIPGAIPDDRLFIPIQSAFENYSSDNFELVLGAATGIIPDNNTVNILANDGTSQEIPYDHLVIASGSKVSGDIPLKLVGTYEATIDKWHELQTRIKEADSIVVAGAGPTGVEVAGELAAKYGSAKAITLIIAGEKPLDKDEAILSSVRDILENDLQKLGVKIIRQTRVNEVNQSNDGKVTLSLSNGIEVTTTCFLPTYGISLNNSFIPPEFLDSQGNVKQDDSMRVTGTKNIWAIGDIGCLEPKQLTVTDNQIIHLASNLDSELREQDTVKPYRQVGKTMLFVSLGTKLATGQIGNWRLWGFMVAFVKGRKLFVDTAAGYVGGKHLRHASM